MKARVRLPLFARIVLGAVVGAALGAALGNRAEALRPIADIVLQLLRLLSTPLIFFCLLRSIINAEIGGRVARRLIWILISNTAMAILIGLAVANILEPGRRVVLPPPTSAVDHKPFDVMADLVGRLPKDFVSPFASNEAIGVILLGFALALALRSVRSGIHLNRIKAVLGYVELGIDVTMTMLHWAFEVVPLAVLAVVARVVGTVGIDSLLKLGWFVASVGLALVLLFGVYLIRLRLSSWVRPADYLRGGFDALVLAFSTSSSIATLPVTYECATRKIGLREETASIGIMVGGTFNHDGGALYEAMAALFVAQALGLQLSFAQQFVVVLMAMIASLGAAGIPHGGLVTMIAVFNSVHLPVDYIPLLLTLDWFLDRCRTMVNVAGDLASTCILDGRKHPSAAS